MTWLNPKLWIYGAFAAVNAAHPFLHAFEGGMLDVWLTYANAWLIQLDPFIPTTNTNTTGENTWQT